MAMAVWFLNLIEYLCRGRKHIQISEPRTNGKHLQQNYNRSEDIPTSSKMHIQIQMASHSVCICLKEITGNNRVSGDPENWGTLNNQ